MTRMLTMAILALCSAGDHIVSASTLYGGTHTLLGVNLKKLGIETTFVHPDDPENFRRAIRPNTKLLYAETLGNPLINIVDNAILAMPAGGTISIRVRPTVLEASGFRFAHPTLEQALRFELGA